MKKIHRRLGNVYGTVKFMFLQIVYYWQWHFLEERKDKHDEARSGRPNDAVKQSRRYVEQVI